MGRQPLEITVTAPGMKEIRNRLTKMKEKSPVIMARAINRTLTHASSRIAKDIKKTYAVDKKFKEDLKKESRVKKAKQDEPTGELAITSEKRIALSRFKLKPEKPSPGSPPKFYQAQIEVGGSMKNMEANGENSKGFLATMKSGHTGMYVRKKGKERKSGPRDRGKFNPYKDEAIVELYGPSIARMAETSKISADVLRDAETFLTKQIEHDIQYFNSKRK